MLGLRAHLCAAWLGIVMAFDLSPANASDLAAAPLLFDGVRGFVLGDRGYWRPRLRGEFLRHGVSLLALSQTVKCEKVPWPRWLVPKRRRSLAHHAH
jgi:hypothetical protein